MIQLERDLIIKYLKRTYPTQRIRHKGSFKRIIIYDGEYYPVSDQNSCLDLYAKLIKNIQTIFATEDSSIKDVLSNFLNLRIV